MEAKIFVIALPSMKSMMEEITSLIEEAFDKPCSKKCERKSEPCKPKCCSQERDFTPPRFKNHTFMPPAPIPQWGVTGKKADENLRFGYGLEVDEPRYQDFDDNDEFLEAREAFDDFVDAGERCVELGIDKRNDAPITKCNAIRKPIGCPPPMNVNLLGESQFPWWEEDFEW